MGWEENLKQWGLLRKAPKSWADHFKRAPGVNACVVAEAEHAVSLDINVLLEGTPPQHHPVTARGRRNKGLL